MTPLTHASLDADNCDICKSVAKIVEDYIESNNTESEIVVQIEKICSTLPGGLAPQCKSIIDLYLPSIIKIIVAGETPEKVCQLFKLCTSFRDNCGTCKLVATIAENLLKSNQTETQIELALDKFCTVLPSNIADECKGLINNNLNNIINLIIAKETPEVICKLLRQC